MPKEKKVRKSPGDKKRKAKKDPNAPKRALSAFMIFSQEKRAAVKDENPEATFGNLFSFATSLTLYRSTW